MSDRMLQDYTVKELYDAFGNEKVVQHFVNVLGDNPMGSKKWYYSIPYLLVWIYIYENSYNGKMATECGMCGINELNKIFKDKLGENYFQESRGEPNINSVYSKTTCLNIYKHIRKKIFGEQQRFLSSDVTIKKIIREIEDIIKDDEVLQKFKFLFGENSKECVRMMKEDKKDKIEYEIIEAIKNGSKQIILTGAPGTGKTRMAKRIANGDADDEIKGENLIWKDERKDESYPRYEFVQFHPSYDYTDFVEGLRPIDENGKIEFKKIDGIFKRFCRYVAECNLYNEINKQNKYYFIIDEINRADLSKVFGELMYCLEADKRGSKNPIQTQYQSLPTEYTTEEKVGFHRFCKKILEKGEEKAIAKIAKKPEKESEKELIWIRKDDVFKDGFYIPENVIIIGTMNDIDRSVESMDFALRRRFEWREIKVTCDLLKEAFEYMCQNDWKDDLAGTDENANFVETIVNTISDRVMKLNHIICPEEGQSSYGLNRQYYISQGQFAGLSSSVIKNLKEDINNFLEAVFNWRIELLLREYLRGEDEGTINEFVKKCKDALLEENKKSADNTAESQLTVEQ